MGTSIDPAEPQPFKPKRLSSRSLRVAVTPGLRRLPEEDRAEIQARRVAADERHRRLSPRVVRRLRYYVAGGAIFVPLMELMLWIVAPVTGRTILYQIPLGAIYGAILAFDRSLPLRAGLLLVLGALLARRLAGDLSFSLATLLIAFLVFCIGYAVGSAEFLKAGDGD